MSKTKNILFSILLFCIFIFGFTGCTANSNDYARITDLDYKAVVVDEPGSQGKIIVTERITFDVHAASKYNGFWELWRDLPESIIDGVKVHYKVNSVKQIMPNGTEKIWEESPKLYWSDYDYVKENPTYGPEKWFHSKGPYNEDLAQYECLLFYVDNLYREKVTFEIEYEMYNAVLKYEDCAELYISLFSGESCKYLKSLNAEFLIPEKDMPKEGDYKATTYGTNNETFEFKEFKDENTNYHVFSFDLDENDLKFKPYNEYIEFALISFGEDKHAFAEHASQNKYSNYPALEEILDEQEYYLSLKRKTTFLNIIILVISLLISVFLIINRNKKYILFKQQYPYYSEKEPDTIFRDIPSDLDPKFAAALVFAKDKKSPPDDSATFAAVLLSLARKKYIKIKEIENSDIMITLSDDLCISNEAIDVNSFKDKLIIEGKEALTLNEIYVLNLLKRNTSTTVKQIKMKALQYRIYNDYDYMKSYTKNVENSIVECGIAQGYFTGPFWERRKKDFKTAGTIFIIFGVLFALINLITINKRIGLAFGSFIILSLVFLILGFYHRYQANKYALLTEFGEQEYQKWRGLYNFLKSDTLINERTHLELPLWEKYLVYATAFGISEKVIQAIKIRCPEIPNSDSIVMNTCCRSGNIHRRSSHIHSSVRTTIRQSSYSSYGGHSSGASSFHYGGGGRGGGGGGGGH